MINLTRISYNQWVFSIKSLLKWRMSFNEQNEKEYVATSLSKLTQLHPNTYVFVFNHTNACQISKCDINVYKTITLGELSTKKIDSLAVGLSYWLIDSVNHVHVRGCVCVYHDGDDFRTLIISSFLKKLVQID